MKSNPQKAEDSAMELGWELNPYIAAYSYRVCVIGLRFCLISHFPYSPIIHGTYQSSSSGI
jgi:hypothetical protein